MEVVGGEYEINLGASAGGRGEAGKGGDVDVKVGTGGGGDEADEGVVTAVAVTVEAAGPPIGGDRLSEREGIRQIDEVV